LASCASQSHFVVSGSRFQFCALPYEVTLYF